MQPSKLDQILGLEIQRRRIEKRWSQEYLAEVTPFLTPQVVNLLQLECQVEIKI